MRSDFSFKSALLLCVMAGAACGVGGKSARADANASAGAAVTTNSSNPAPQTAQQAQTEVQALVNSPKARQAVQAAADANCLAQKTAFENDIQSFATGWVTGGHGYDPNAFETAFEHFQNDLDALVACICVSDTNLGSCQGNGVGNNGTNNGQGNGVGNNGQGNGVGNNGTNNGQGNGVGNNGTSNGQGNGVGNNGTGSVQN